VDVTAKTAITAIHKIQCGKAQSFSVWILGGMMAMTYLANQVFARNYADESLEWVNGGLSCQQAFKQRSAINLAVNWFDHVFGVGHHADDVAIGRNDSGDIVGCAIGV
jgi:hypothetical protein